MGLLDGSSHRRCSGDDCETLRHGRRLDAPTGCNIEVTQSTYARILTCIHSCAYVYVFTSNHSLKRMILKPHITGTKMGVPVLVMHKYVGVGLEHFWRECDSSYESPIIVVRFCVSFKTINIQNANKNTRTPTKMPPSDTIFLDADPCMMCTLLIFKVVIIENGAFCYAFFLHISPHFCFTRSTVPPLPCQPEAADSLP